MTLFPSEFRQPKSPITTGASSNSRTPSSTTGEHRKEAISGSKEPIGRMAPQKSSTTCQQLPAPHQSPPRAQSHITSDVPFTYSLGHIDAVSKQLRIPWERSKGQSFGSSFTYIGFLWDIDDIYHKTVMLTEHKREKYHQAILEWDRSLPTSFQLPPTSQTSTHSPTRAQERALHPWLARNGRHGGSSPDGRPTTKTSPLSL